MGMMETQEWASSFLLADSSWSDSSHDSPAHAGGSEAALAQAPWPSHVPQK